MNANASPTSKTAITDYCPFDACPRKQKKLFTCMKRFFKVIEKYCPLFNYTEEERNAVFRRMEETGQYDVLTK